MKFATKGKNKKTSLENKLAQQFMDAGCRGRYRRNALFIEGRQFKADFYFPSLLLVVEVDGGEWLGKRGGHTSGTGYRSDRERDALAAMQHIHTLRFAGAQVKDGTAIEVFKEFVPVRKAEVDAFREAGLI